MPTPKDVYVNCDILEHIPEQNRNNWLEEIRLLQEILPNNARVLQVGSMDGTRAIGLMKVRPDLKFTGIEIEESLVELARKNVISAGLDAEFIHGDITNPPLLSMYDYVICLNNTLGYIPEQEKAIDGMKKLGKHRIVSVYGEKFDDALAQTYFRVIGLDIDFIDANHFIMKDFTTVRRYTRQKVEALGGKIIETPVGYFCVF